MVLTAVILFGLFNKMVLNANQLSFTDYGDGLKSTFGTVYHIKHDDAYWQTLAMNYPFGESVFFTGNQAVLSNSLKLLKDAGWDLSDYAMGISNILILLSYVIASLLIYLIFRELKMDGWMAVPASLIIILLSNQWERIGGHYNLAYAYLIPVILYLLLRFYRKPTYLVSVIFGILVILFSAKQLYVAAFILVLWIPFWIFIFFQDREKFGKPGFVLSHVLIQFILPFILFSLFTGMHDPGVDRTSYPWGFYLSRIRLEAVFLPDGLPHGKFLHIKGPLRSKAYVSLLGTFVTAYIFVTVLINLWRKRSIQAFRVSDQPAWNILFWAGVISLFIAMGWPFSPGWDRLLNYTGPFRQLRAIGRFVFPFYYTMTITSFLVLWKWYTTTPFRFKTVVLVLVLLFTGYESVAYIWKVPRTHEHAIDWHSGIYNRSEQNEWYTRHDFTQYQAIVPLPYFHIGSENYWLGDQSPVIVPAYAAAVGTGLPLTAVMLSRTSITQTLMNLDLIMEPYHEFPILKEFPDSRPLLLLRHKKGVLTGPEKALVAKASKLDENDALLVYSLSLDSIPGLIADRQRELESMVMKEAFGKDSLLWTAREGTGILFEDFSDEEGGLFRSEFINPTTLYEAIMPDTGNYLVSFWFDGADRDLWPRTQFWTELYREDGSKYLYKFTDFFHEMVLRNGTWGLIEYQIHVEQPNSRLKIAFKNRIITKGQMTIDRLLVRPSDQIHVVRENGETWVNNRQLLIKEVKGARLF